MSKFQQLRHYFFLLVFLVEMLALHESLVYEKPIPAYQSININLFYGFLQPSSSDLLEPVLRPPPNMVGNSPIQSNLTFYSFSQTSSTTTQKPEIVTLVRVPASIGIFMNFQNDGTTSVQFLNDYNLFWSDLGNCRHGQIYDSGAGICRDVFCNKGYILTAQGCVRDDNSSSSLNQPIKPPPPEMKIEITLSHTLCYYLIGYNETVKCNHTAMLKPTPNFLKELKLKLSEGLEINDKRIDEMKELSYKNVMEPFVEISSLNSTTDDKEQKFNRMILIEYLKICFLIKDKNLFENEKKDTIMLFYYLNLVSMSHREKPYLIDGHTIRIAEVYEANSTHSQGWCNSIGEEKLFLTDGFNILASFDNHNKPTYYMYVNETETLYETGNFYLSVLFQTPNVNIKSVPNIKLKRFEDFKDQVKIEDLTQSSYSSSDVNHKTIDHKDKKKILDSLTDVTGLVLESSITSNEVTNKLLTVCNRAPKISDECDNYKTIRLRLCELIRMKDRSYCSKFTKVCYSIHEYEEDDYEPNKYIRVCKQKAGKHEQSIEVLKQTTNLSLLIPGWLSIILTVLSLIALIIVLITYVIFSELRNIPGWNLINLTISLLVAQSSFLTGSLVSDIPLACFLVSLLTHYSYLASFFWMNVIAFDLHRNFKNKASHILITTVRVRSRISKYAFYAWLSPLAIVFSGLMVDLFLRNNELKKFKPCYGAYLHGCDQNNLIQPFEFTNPTLLKNISASSSNNQTEACAPNFNDISAILLSRTCWIKNGSSNLLFFGLPIALFIIINSVYYFLTIYNIRKMKNNQKKSQMRRFSRVKLPIDADVKFYIRMAFVMGFTWLTGFIMTTFSLSNQILYQIFLYIFILSNSTSGIFIFFSFVFKKEIKKLYKEFFVKKFNFNNSDTFEISRAINRARSRSRVYTISESEAANKIKERAASESSTNNFFPKNLGRSFSSFKCIEFINNKFKRTSLPTIPEMKQSTSTTTMVTTDSQNSN